MTRFNDEQLVMIKLLEMDGVPHDAAEATVESERLIATALGSAVIVALTPIAEAVAKACAAIAKFEARP